MFFKTEISHCVYDLLQPAQLQQEGQCKAMHLPEDVRQ